MKDFVIDFLKLLSGCTIVICLAFASFLLLSNFYHYEDVAHVTTFDFNENTAYKEYKSTMAKVDKKMNSVNIKGVKYDVTAKPIYDFYKTCKIALDKGTFSKKSKGLEFTSKDVYDMNNEILNDYNSKCVFGIPYNIKVMAEKYNTNVPFNSVFDKTQEKRTIVIDNAYYLTRAQLGNSSYSFVTDITRGGIYDKTKSELGLTINNYNLMASILDDVANWYVAEYGGNA